MSTAFFSWFILAAGAYAGSLLFALFKSRRTAGILLIFGFVSHSLSLLARGWHFGVFLPLNLLGKSLFIPWCLAAATLALWKWPRSRETAPTLVAPLCALMAIAALQPSQAIPPAPQTATVLAPLFFFCEGIAHVMFLVAGWLAALFLHRRATHDEFNNWAIWGFVIYSFAQVTGAVWSWLGWSVPFHWGEGHLISAALWCFYCAYLHLDFSRQWSARGKAWFASAGALFTFVVSYYQLFASLGGKNG